MKVNSDQAFGRFHALSPGAGFEPRSGFSSPALYKYRNAQDSLCAPLISGEVGDGVVSFRRMK